MMKDHPFMQRRSRIATQHATRIVQCATLLLAQARKWKISGQNRLGVQLNQQAFQRQSHRLRPLPERFVLKLVLGIVPVQLQSPLPDQGNEIDGKGTWIILRPFLRDALWTQKPALLRRGSNTTEIIDTERGQTRRIQADPFGRRRTQPSQQTIVGSNRLPAHQGGFHFEQKIARIQIACRRSKTKWKHAGKPTHRTRQIQIPLSAPTMLFQCDGQRRISETAPQCATQKRGCALGASAFDELQKTLRILFG